MPFIKAKSSQASGWGWMLSMLAFPLLFHHLQDWQTKATLWVITHPRFQILNWTHPDLVAPLVNVLALFSTLIPLLGFALYGWTLGRRSWQSMGFKRPLIGPYLLGFILGGLQLLACLIIPALLGHLSLERISQTPVLVTLLYLAGFLVQGLSEEVICRGYLMNGLALRFPTWLAVLANSLIFAAMHLGNPNVSTLALVNLTLAGLTFSLLFAYTENIWFVGAAHSAWNFVQGPVLGIQVSGMSLPFPIWRTRLQGPKLWTGGDFGLEGGLYCLIVEVLAILILIYLVKAKAQKKVQLEAKS